MKKLKYNDISPALRRFIGAHEAYRKAGFPADDIYCEVARSLRGGDVLSCFALLRTEGREFRIECGAIEDESAFREEHRRTTEAVGAGEVDQETLNRIWQESEVYQNPGEFVSALVRKGIVPKPYVCDQCRQTVASRPDGSGIVPHHCPHGVECILERGDPRIGKPGWHCKVCMPEVRTVRIVR